MLQSRYYCVVFGRIFCQNFHPELTIVCDWYTLGLHGMDLFFGPVLGKGGGGGTES